MSLLYKETCEPLDCYDIVKCLDYSDAGRIEYFEVKQLKEFTRVHRITGKTTTTKDWRMAVYYTWIGGGEMGPRRVPNRYEFLSIEEAQEYIEHLRSGTVYNTTRREIIQSIGDQCDAAV